LKKAALFLALATFGMAQTPVLGKNPEFEVASIRPAKQDNNTDIENSNGRFLTHNLTLRRLVAYAYDIDVKQVFGGPNWADRDSYDINAKAPDDRPRRTREEGRQMIQSLLADRFQLVIHREPRQLSGLALVLAKKEPKMGRAKPDEPSGFHGNNTQLTATNVTMEAFARYLASRAPDLDKLVIDKTGLTGGYDFTLEWMREPAGAKPPDTSFDNRPSIFTALEEQLGLRLESAKIPIQAVVIDRAEKPEEN
jgi:uncharacterized protein (TIGR03435 family)